jgi:acyl-CoA dehydrogenase
VGENTGSDGDLDLEGLRRDVRAFVADEISSGRISPECDSWVVGFDRGFTRRLAEHGWIGMTIPKRFGGGDRSPLERYVVIEELLAAGAPVQFHWYVDRQLAAGIVRFGSEELGQAFLPRITAGVIGFGAGMSEPDSGSDLASIRTTAVRDGDTWILNGSKIWSSNAHLQDYMMMLVRTSSAEGKKHSGLSQIILDMRTPGIEIRPIHFISGIHHFNEVVMQDVRVPASNLLGEEGQGWSQITSELVLERSGPERFLSTMPLANRLAAECSGARASEVVGVLGANLATLRRMSFAVAETLAAGSEPDEISALFVKHMGAGFERDVIEKARELGPQTSWSGDLLAAYRQAILQSPGFSLRGGTLEIVEGIIARRLGLR